MHFFFIKKKKHKQIDVKRLSFYTMLKFEKEKQI